VAKFLAHGMEPEDPTPSPTGKDKEATGQGELSASQLSSHKRRHQEGHRSTFANDQYWLLLPFHLVWDGAAVTDDDAKAPLGDASVNGS